MYLLSVEADLIWNKQTFLHARLTTTHDFSLGYMCISIFFVDSFLSSLFLYLVRFGWPQHVYGLKSKPSREKKERERKLFHFHPSFLPSFLPFFSLPAFPPWTNLCIVRPDAGALCNWLKYAYRSRCSISQIVKCKGVGRRDRVRATTQPAAGPGVE